MIGEGRLAVVLQLVRASCRPAVEGEFEIGYEPQVTKAFVTAAA